MMSKKLKLMLAAAVGAAALVVPAPAQQDASSGGRESQSSANNPENQAGSSQGKEPDRPDRDDRQSSSDAAGNRSQDPRSNSPSRDAAGTRQDRDDRQRDRGSSQPPSSRRDTQQSSTGQRSSRAQNPFTSSSADPAARSFGNQFYDHTYFQPNQPAVGGLFARSISDEEAKLAQEASAMVRRLGQVKDEQTRDDIKQRLTKLLGDQFDLRQKRHEAEIRTLEAKVRELKDLVEKRQENRREIVANRLDQLLREAQGLGW
jgi:hypothetical protein